MGRRLGSGRAAYTSFRDCRRCGERFGNIEADDYRNCVKCRIVVERAARGSLSAGKFSI